MGRLTTLLCTILTATLLTSCASFPPNSELVEFDRSTGYRFADLDPGPGNTDSLFVVVVMSGGGTRAAALSYGVLEALRDTPIRWKGQDKSLLDEVDIVSSVSGGSFTAAYFALHHEALFDGTYEQVFLKHDVEGDLLRKLLVPTNLLRILGPSFGRSDLAAEYHNEHIFKGATYRQLIEQNSRPFLVVNATDMSLGAQFPFIQDQFDLLCSDLSSLPLGRSVASSSAFPGLLTPLTFENYSGSCGFKDYPWVELAEEDRRMNADRAIRADQRRSYYTPPVADGSRRFVHLVDGGVSDNIGLRGPYYAISSTDPAYSILRMMNNEEVEKLVVIVVNAATDPEKHLDESASVPGLTKVLTAAATVPLDNYSVDTVALLRSKISEFNAGYDNLRDCSDVLGSECPGKSLDASGLHPVDLYLVEVAFEFIPDPGERAWFKNLPTNFHLPPKTVDRLRHVGCTLYGGDPELDQLLNGAGRTSDRVSGTPPQCGPRPAP